MKTSIKQILLLNLMQNKMGLLHEFLENKLGSVMKLENVMDG